MTKIIETSAIARFNAKYHYDFSEDSVPVVIEAMIKRCKATDDLEAKEIAEALEIRLYKSNPPADDLGE